MKTRTAVVTSLLALLALAGCINDPDGVSVDSRDPSQDAPLLAPTFGQYHVSATLAEDLFALETAHPDLVDVHEVGRSVQGKPILVATITNEAMRQSDPDRMVAFVDGCHHGSEYQGCEAPLFLAYLLAQNYARNATVASILDRYEVHVMPVMNPDGFDRVSRPNHNGINLNRNYPTDHGNPLGLSYPLGPPVTPITAQVDEVCTPGDAVCQEVLCWDSTVEGHTPADTPDEVPLTARCPFLPTENGGWAPISEPEARAVDRWLHHIEGGQRHTPATDTGHYESRLAVYLTYHTATHSIVVPWAAHSPPFEIPADEDAFFDDALDWINTHTTYKGGRIGIGDNSGNLNYAASGSSQDWAYEHYRVPSFTIETHIQEQYRDQFPGDVDFWGHNAIVFPLKVLMDLEAVKDWHMPDQEFPYPQDWYGQHVWYDQEPPEPFPEEGGGHAHL